MASPMPQGGMANALLRPAEGPTRFGGVAAPTGPQLPAGALRLPPPAAPAPRPAAARIRAASKAATTLPCVVIAPFGRPVVPLV